jgi:hypothetical protein
MADIVTTQVLSSGGTRHTVILTNVSDGTGEAAVAKVSRAGLFDAHGHASTRLAILDVLWVSQGFDFIKLAFDHTADDTVLVLTGSGEIGFEAVGGLPDPGSAGGTGDLLLTVPGGQAGATYTIVLQVRK